MLRVRTSALAALALAAALLVGCESNNKGKIEGKWKVVSGTGSSSGEYEKNAKEGVFLYFEFRPDGTFALGQWIEMGEEKKGIGKEVLTAKYKLKSGDTVELTNLPKELQGKGGSPFGNRDRARMKITISGNDMTASDDSGTMKLTKIQ